MKTKLIFAVVVIALMCGCTTYPSYFTYDEIKCLESGGDRYFLEGECVSYSLVKKICSNGSGCNNRICQCGDYRVGIITTTSTKLPDWCGDLGWFGVDETCVGNACGGSVVYVWRNNLTQVPSEDVEMYCNTHLIKRITPTTTTTTTTTTTSTTLPCRRSPDSYDRECSVTKYYENMSKLCSLNTGAFVNDREVQCDCIDTVCVETSFERVKTEGIICKVIGLNNYCTETEIVHNIFGEASFPADCQIKRHDGKEWCLRCYQGEVTRCEPEYINVSVCVRAEPKCGG